MSDIRNRSMLVLLMTLIVGLLLFGAMVQGKEDMMKLVSPAFSSEGMIPSQFTCDGKNVSPKLTWSDEPSGTKSFALIADDPDAPMGTWVHWVYFNIPSSVHELSEGIPAVANPSLGGVHGKNDFGKLGYGGPCPPGGTHRYFFKLYALDCQLKLSQGATKREVEKAMKGHVLAQATLMGKYKRHR